MTQRIVYTCPDENCLVVIQPAEGWTVQQVIEKDIPEGVTCTVIEESDLPSDRAFREAWTEQGPNAINEPLEACKEICHQKRRVCREAEFKPHDEVIMKQIPGADSANAEQCRSEIREKYAAIQTRIDAASDSEGLRVVLRELGDETVR